MEFAKLSVINDLEPSLNGHDPADVEVEFTVANEEHDPVLTAIAGLHFAYVAARGNPDEQSHQELKDAWANVLLQMPQDEVPLQEPVKPPQTEHDIHQLGYEALEADHDARIVFGPLLARVAILSHPDAQPLDEAGVEAFNRVRLLTAYVSDRLGEMLDKRRRD